MKNKRKNRWDVIFSYEDAIRGLDIDFLKHLCKNYEDDLKYLEGSLMTELFSNRQDTPTNNEQLEMIEIIDILIEKGRDIKEHNFYETDTLGYAKGFKANLVMNHISKLQRKEKLEIINNIK